MASIDQIWLVGDIYGERPVTWSVTNDTVSDWRTGDSRDLVIGRWLVQVTPVPAAG